jgi:hypothetical protein
MADVVFVESPSPPLKSAGEKALDVTQFREKCGLESSA